MYFLKGKVFKYYIYINDGIGYNRRYSLKDIVHLLNDMEDRHKRDQFIIKRLKVKKEEN